MKTYTVQVTIELTKQVEVTATSEDDARKKAILLADKQLTAYEFETEYSTEILED